MNQIYALALIIGIPLVFAAARYLKDLDEEIPGWLFRSLAAGIVAGSCAVLLSLWLPGRLFIVAIGVLLGSAVLFVSRRSAEHDVLDGVLTGGLVAVGVALPLALRGETPLALLTTLTLAGVASGGTAAWLITRSMQSAASHVLTITASITGALVASRIPAFAEPLTVASATAVMSALIAAGSVLWRSHAVASELREEAGLGLLDETLALRIAHPVRRMTPEGMSSEANRKVVRLGWALALEKRRQRTLDDAHARLRQLEILNLRKQLGETLQVIREIEAHRSAAAPDADRQRSDTIAVKG